jgi:hypothetical protein
MSGDGGIHATRDHNNIKGVLWNTNKMCQAIQNKRGGMLTYSVVLFHNIARLHTAAHTQGLLEHFNCELSDHPTYRPDLTPSDYHLHAYLKNWLGS